MNQAASLLSREAELSQIEQFLTTGRSSGLLMTGKPGIGKTTLWEAGLNTAKSHGYQVVSAQASEAESLLSFSALNDMVEAIDDADLATLPSPQLNALQVVLRRVEPGNTPPDQLAVAAGFLGALRAIAQRSPVLVAIDDLQWLDRSSLDVLLFVAHRVSGKPIRFLMAQRADTPQLLTPHSTTRTSSNSPSTA